MELAAQEAYAETGAFPALLAIYHLFGDPALLISIGWPNGGDLAAVVDTCQHVVHTGGSAAAPGAKRWVTFACIRSVWLPQSTSGSFDVDGAEADLTPRYA